MRLRAFPAAILCVTAVTASLPTSALAQLRQVPTISAEAAQRALAAAQAEAARNQWNVSIAVVDPSGDLIAFTRMDGASVASVDVAQQKARTSARFRRATRYYDSVSTAGRLQVMTLKGMTPIEGGIPVIVNGVVVGAIGVSGATSAQDAQCATAGAAVIRP
jgi:glc operon protein GlcG